MYFNKLELFLIKLFKLNQNTGTPKIMKKFYDVKAKFMSNPNNKEEHEKKSSKYDQPSGGDEQPKGKKVLWSFFIALFIILFFGLIILSGFSFSATKINVREIRNGPNNNSYVLVTDDNNQITISTSNRPNLYVVESRADIASVEVTYGTSPFSSFFFNAQYLKANITNSVNSVDLVYVLKLSNLYIYSDGTTTKVYTQSIGTGIQPPSSGTNTTNSPNVKYTDVTITYASLATSFSNYESNLTATKPQPYSFSTVTNIMLSLLPLLFIFGFLFWSMKRMGGAGGAGQDNVFSIGKSQAKLAQSNISFQDVAGIEEEKEELIEIVDYLKRPDKYASMGARVPKGVILYGPPGTGKTLLAKAVAGEAGVPFFQVSGSAFEDMLVGVGAKRVRDLFSKAVKAAPAIIFIDEIDSVGSKRGKLDTTAGSLADQTLNQLLAEMDGFSPRTGVIVIAATNRLDVLDDALLRPGRFDRHIRVNLPDIKERVAILKIHSKNKNVSSSVDLEDVARRTPGFSGAQLENVLNEATILAVRKNKKSIGMIDIDEAIDRVIAGPAKKTRVISLEEKKQIAFHEAGHAIVGLYTKGSEVVEKITIIPRGQAAGYTLSVPEVQELSIQKKSDLLGMVAGLLGGRAAEELVFGKNNVSTGAANDLYKATNIVRAMVGQLGMSSVGMAQYYPSEGTTNPYQTKLFSEQTSISMDKEIEKIFRERYEYASKIIRDHRRELDLIVESLLLLETIVKPQINYIHKYKKLPREALEKKEELEEKRRAEKAMKNAENEMILEMQEE